MSELERFAHAATEGRRDVAEAALAAEPGLGDDRWVRLLLGEGWEGAPDEVGGPLDWAPLHYACHSLWDTLDVARALLEAGADPNAVFPNGHGPMSTLYGAAGVKHDPRLTALLLAHGADPNGEPHFGDALYHAAEADDSACLRALLEGGARVPGSSALGLALDFDHPEHVRLLIDHGADLAESPFLVHAVRRGRSAAIVAQLLDAGAPVDAVGGEWSTPESQYRTAYANAVLRNRDDLVDLLARHGADPSVSDADRAVAAVARGEVPAQPLAQPLDADPQEALVFALLAGHADAVLAAVGPSFFGHCGGGPPGTLLHHASWVGNAATVRRLLADGADPRARSGAQWDTPLAWAVLGSGAFAVPGRDYVAVAEALLAAGAEIEPRFADVAAGPLRERLHSED